MSDAGTKQPETLANVDGSARGHDERKLGRKLTYCLKCKAKKPARGGWQFACAGVTAEKRRMWG